MKIRNFTKNKSVVGVTAALGVLLGAEVNAQSSMLEEVVVTAQKREQNAQDISISVSAYTGEQLSALGVTGAKELAAITPGVQINMEYGNAPTFTIRGVNVNDFGVGTSPAAAVYVDGIYKASNINSGVQLFDLERVEILKGPQGTLWGKNTTGGAVSVITNKPTQETEGYAMAGFGSYNRFEMEGAVGGAITDTLSGRISMQSITADGPYDNVTFPGQPRPGSLPTDPEMDQRAQFFGIADEDPGDVDTMAVRGQLLWDLENVEILAIAHYARDRGENHPTTSLYDSESNTGDPDVFDENVSNEFVFTRDSEFKGASLEMTFDMGDNAQLVSITGYDYFDRAGGLDTNGGAGQAPAAPGFTQVYFTEFTQLTQEVRYEVTDDRLFWLVGGFYSDSEINQNDDDHYSIGYFFAPFNYRYEHHNESLGIFSHVEYEMSDTIKLTGGLRYDDEERRQPFYATWYGSPPFGPDLGGSIDQPTDLVFEWNLADNRLPDAPPQTFTTDGISYKLGVDYTPSDTMLLYYSHSKGLKSGGYRSDAFTSTGELASFDDEELFSHEFGMKWDPSDDLRVNAAVFIYDYQDVQQKIPTVIEPFGELNTMANMDSADVTGFELEVIWNASESLQLGLNASLLDTEISDASAFDGNDLPFAPDSAVGGFVRYESSMGGDMQTAAQLMVNHTGDHYTDVNGPNGKFGAQSYTLIDANYSITSSSGWQLSLYGRNLGNEIYWTNTFSDVGGFISEPRQYGARLRFDF